jgi:hypothetical protein
MNIWINILYNFICLIGFFTIILYNFILFILHNFIFKKYFLNKTNGFKEKIMSSVFYIELQNI